jgi:hypothetical protein
MPDSQLCDAVVDTTKDSSVKANGNVMKPGLRLTFSWWTVENVPCAKVRTYFGCKYEFCLWSLSSLAWIFPQKKSLLTLFYLAFNLDLL